MKANEAPDKIYLNPLLMEDGESIVRRCTFERQRDSQIEYTRTDAFIEKALAYLDEKFNFDNLHYVVQNNTLYCIEEMFEDFENYMKGE